jgi:hypothetical protein
MPTENHRCRTRWVAEVRRWCFTILHDNFLQFLYFALY